MKNETGSNKIFHFTAGLLTVYVCLQGRHVWAACFMWAAWPITTHTALSQTERILCSSDTEHVSPQSKRRLSQYSTIIIL